MEVKRATPEMAGQLVSLAKAMGYEADEAGIKKRVAKISVNPEHCLLVAEEAGKLVGFCHGYVRTLVEVPEAVEIGGCGGGGRSTGQGSGETVGGGN